MYSQHDLVKLHGGMTRYPTLGNIRHFPSATSVDDISAMHGEGFMDMVRGIFKAGKKAATRS